MSEHIEQLYRDQAYLVGWYRRSIQNEIDRAKYSTPEDIARRLQWSLDNAEIEMNKDAPEVSRARIETNTEPN